MRACIPNPRYSPVCNVLRQWKTSLIPTYRVYQLYDIELTFILTNLINYFFNIYLIHLGVLIGVGVEYIVVLAIGSTLLVQFLLL